MPPLNQLNRTCLALAVGQVLALPAAQAITVTSALDDGTDCTLREAIDFRNMAPVDPGNGCTAGSGSDIIDFSISPSATITLAASLPRITSDVTFNGPGQDALTIHGSGSHSVLSIDSATVSINSLSIIGGSATYGGGIEVQNSSHVTLSHSTLSGNSAVDGGGVYAKNSTVTLNNSTLSGNRADYGGGIYASESMVSPEYSTVSGNSAVNGDGGGIYGYKSAITLGNSTVSGNGAEYGGGISAYESMVTLDNSTISVNRADTDGGGLYADSSTVSLNNSIVSGNIATGVGAEIYENSVVFISNKANLLGHAGITNSEAFADAAYFTPVPYGDFDATSDYGNVSLSSIQSSLQDHGGPTLTHGLVKGSPAIDAGDNINCPLTDQRGEPRDDGKCDIGAFEGFVLIDGQICYVINGVNGNTVVFCL